MAAPLVSYRRSSSHPPGCAPVSDVADRLTIATLVFWMRMGTAVHVSPAKQAGAGLAVRRPVPPTPSSVTAALQPREVGTRAERGPAARGVKVARKRQT